jgi:hypothetical protein
MPFQNPQRIATRNRSVLASVAGQHDPRHSFARSNSRCMSSMPTAPASSRTINRCLDKTGFDCNKLCSVFASNPSFRKTSVAAAVGAQNSGSTLRFFAGSDQLAQRRSFARACQVRAGP